MRGAYTVGRLGEQYAVVRKFHTSLHRVENIVKTIAATMRDTTDKRAYWLVIGDDKRLTEFLVTNVIQTDHSNEMELKPPAWANRLRTMPLTPSGPGFARQQTHIGVAPCRF